MVKPKIETEDQKKYRELVESIAGNIGTLAKAVNNLINGPLKKKALIVLLASSAKLPMTTVEKVVGALENLEADWLNRK